MNNKYFIFGFVSCVLLKSLLEDIVSIIDVVDFLKNKNKGGN